VVALLERPGDGGLEIVVCPGDGGRKNPAVHPPEDNFWNSPYTCIYL
jgi:hypothetical protein